MTREMADALFECIEWNREVRLGYIVMAYVLMAYEVMAYGWSITT